MSNTAIIISEGRSDLYALPQDVRIEIQEMEAIFREADTLGYGVKGPYLEGAAARLGQPEKTLKNKYAAWVKAGRVWQVLLNKTRVRLPGGKLPEEFLEFWRGLCERNQRGCRAAYRTLVRGYRMGEVIPGYNAKRSRSELPKGWTYSNLMRHAPTKFELTAARRGRSAAAQFRPLVFSTRVGLECGQFYIFDDVEHDHKVNFLGVNRKAMRPLELAAIDLLSGKKIAYGLKPTIIGDDGAKEKLKEREMLFLVAHTLYNIGYRPEGTTLIVEHGTAAIRERVERIVADATDGAVTVSRSGREGAATFAGVYEGRSKGNSRFKAPLESHHSLAHNELAALPGQMGKDYEHAPEEMHGRDRHNNALIKAVAALPEERAAMLRLPFIPWHEFSGICAEIYRRIDERIDHKLEGWEEAGFVVNEFRVTTDGDWMPMQMIPELPAEEQAAVQALITRAGYVQCRRMSPAEVWQRGSMGLAKIGPQHVSAILGPDLAIARKVGKNHLFEFEDREIGPGIHRYLSQVTTTLGRELLLKPGETYLVQTNPFQPDQLFVSTETSSGLQFVGIAPRWGSVSRTDVDALHRQMGAAAAMEKTLLTPVATRGAELTRRRIADAQHNAAVLAGAPITKAEISRADEVRGTHVSSADLDAATTFAPDEEETFSQDEITNLLRNDN